MRAVMLAAAVIIGLAGGLAAKPALRDVPEIDDGLFVVGLAHLIRKNCPSIEARFFRALGAVNALEQEARDRGYSREEIRAHIDSKAEKARLRARATRYMDAQGLEPTETGYCALGQAEIARKSQIGALLRASQ